MPTHPSQRPLIIVADQLGWHVRDLLRAAAAARVRAQVVSFRRLIWTADRTGGQLVRARLLEPPPRPSPTDDELVPLLRPSGGEQPTVLVRCMPAGSLEQIVFRLDLLHVLARCGVTVVNPPRALELAIDKTLSLALLRQAGLPTPATAVAENRTEAIAALEQLGGQAVVKPVFGSEGKGVYRVTDRDQAWQAFSLLERLGAVIYLQEYVADVAVDVRALVLSGEVIAAVARNHPHDWRRNATRGARVRPYRLDAEAAALAVRAAETLGVEFAGVDLLFSRGRGPLVLEVNAVPGWRATRRATGLDVAALLLQHARRRQTPPADDPAHPARSRHGGQRG